MKVTERGIRNVAAYLDTAEGHAKHLSEHIDPEDERIMEFGAGRDLFNGLFLLKKGYKKQLIVDIEPLARYRAMNALLAQPPFEGMCAPFTELFVAELRSLGIDYRAPFDMRRTPLEDASVSAVVSTSTLEHIPSADLLRIIAESHRVLRRGGICSFFIDYSDHYSHTDRRIGSYNFLQYSERMWRFLSPPNHYQNRLRHNSFVELFQAGGFQLLYEQPHRNMGWERELQSLRIAPEFGCYTASDLSWTSAWFLLRKP